MTAVKVLDQRDTLSWERYVRDHEQATLFHSSRWKQVVENGLGHPGYYLYVQTDEGIQGILPLFLCASALTDRALVALPFAGTQPSLCASSTAARQPLLEAALNLARDLRADYLELREAQPQSWSMELRQSYVNARLSLSGGAEAVWRQRLQGPVRTKVRAARRRGLHVEWSGRERLNEFYGIYTETLHRLGSPAHGERLFQAVFEHFQDQAELALVMDGQRAVAGAVVMHDESWMGFPWAASRTEALPRHPNNLLYWAIIEKACERGYTALDLGRSPAGSGTLHFKQQWGAEARPLWYYFGLVRARQAPRRDALDRKMIFASKCWRRLPGFLAALLGPALARLIP